MLAAALAFLWCAIVPAAAQTALPNAAPAPASAPIPPMGWNSCNRFGCDVGANGLALSARGGLLIADSGRRSPDRIGPHTRRRTIPVDRYRSRRFNSPKDLHVACDGALFCTVPGGCMVMTSAAEPLGLIEWSGSIANCIFDEGVWTFFLTASGSVFGMPFARGHQA